MAAPATCQSSPPHLGRPVATPTAWYESSLKSTPIDKRNRIAASEKIGGVWTALICPNEIGSETRSRYAAPWSDQFLVRWRANEGSGMPLPIS